MNDSINHAVSGYGRDEHAWLLQQADALRAKRYDQIDPEELSESLRDMAARERRELRNRLIVLLMHLIKCELSPGAITRSWLLTIEEQQDQIKQILADSPSLEPFAHSIYADAVTAAYRRAKLETGIDTADLPGLADRIGNLHHILTVTKQPTVHSSSPA